MRYLSFRAGTRESWGVLVGPDRVVDLPVVAPGEVPAALGGLVRAGADAQRRTGALAATVIGRSGVPLLSLASLTLLPPFRPTKNVFCLGANYADHAKEGGHERPQAPIYFTKSAVALAGPYDDIEVDPTLTRNLDWEIELAVVMGRGGRHIPPEQALAHVFGYTVINDVSARDIQHSRGQWFLGKNLHRSSPIGPWIVTADEIPDPQKLDLELRVNGAVKQKTSTRNMIFSVVDAIVDLSRHLELESGDVIATGTCSGVGAARTPPEFLREGDLLETEIPAIGTLRNRIRERIPRGSDR